MHNNTSDALIAIETALGTTPYGSYATVKAAIADMVQKTPSAADQIVMPSADHVALVTKQGGNLFISNLLEARDHLNNILFYIDYQGNLNAQGFNLQGSNLLNNTALTGNPTAPTQSSGNSSTRIATTAFVTTALGAAVPTGTIIPFAGSTAPSGYLLCNGSAVSRSTYATLFTLLNGDGLKYGVGDGSTTFNVPDIQGRMLVGLAGSTGHIDVKTLGNNDGATIGNRRPKHNHTNSATASHNLTLPNHIHSAVTTLTAKFVAGDSSVSDVDWLTNDGGTNTDTPIDLTAATSVGNPTSNPSIPGSVTIGGTIGPSGTNPSDTSSYLVVNYIIKT